MQIKYTLAVSFLIAISTIVTNAVGVSAFQSPAVSLNSRKTSSTSTKASTTLLRDTAKVEEIMTSQYPIFMKLIMSKNADMWKKLSDASSGSNDGDENGGITIFAANDNAMKNLGEKRLSQLEDVRNGKRPKKMAGFHAIGELVTADALYNSGGVVTIGGVIDVGRSRSGGFMGIGGKEDGGITINGAKIVQTTEVDSNCLIHEVDMLVSPEILWRYCDQLRIPGSN